MCHVFIKSLGNKSEKGVKIVEVEKGIERGN